MIAAWLFAKYITGTNQTAEFATQSGYIPIRNSAFDCPLYKTWEGSIKENPTTQVQAQDKLVRDVFNVFRQVQESFFTSVVFNLGAKTRTEVGALLAEILAYAGSDVNAYIEERYREHYNLIIS
jgi:ABC-type glycerol-3-phosphate transport system substrate-binding protein